MTMLKFLVDGGSGVAYVLAEEIAAVIPARPDSSDGAQIVLRTGQGLTVLNDCAEVAADWESAVTDKGRLGAYVDGQIARRERLGLPPLSDERGA